MIDRIITFRCAGDIRRPAVSAARTLQPFGAFALGRMAACLLVGAAVAQKIL